MVGNESVEARLHVSVGLAGAYNMLFTDGGGKRRMESSIGKLQRKRDQGAL